MLLIYYFAIKSRFALWYTLYGFLSYYSFPLTLAGPGLSCLVILGLSFVLILINQYGSSHGISHLYSSKTDRVSII